MKRYMFAFLTVLLISAPLFAHHSFMGQYDLTKTVVLKGAVTKVEWENPHISINIDVTDERGVVTNWTFESAPPAALVSRGWTRTTLKAGDQITIEACPARKGTPFAAAKVVKLADGRRLLAHSDGVTPTGR